MDDELNGKHDAYAVLKVPDFRLFLTFRFFTTIAFQMQSIIVGWQMYELTRDPLALGLIGLAEALPNISVVLYAGHAADRYNRKRIIIWFTLLFLTGTSLLFLFTVRSLGIIAALGVLPIYGVVMISGISRAFLYPSIIALMSQLIPRYLYTNASTWNSTAWHVAAITGPAIGGLVYGFFGVRNAYLTVLFFLFLALLLLSFVKNRPAPPVNEEEKLLQRLSSGLKFVFRNQVLSGAMSLDMFAVLFGGAVAMLPVFAAEVLMVGSGEDFGVPLPHLMCCYAHGLMTCGPSHDRVRFDRSWTALSKILPVTRSSHAQRDVRQHQRDYQIYRNATDHTG